MITQAVRLYGVNDLRLETFELPPIQPDEILAKVVSDSICMSSYKAATQGAAHKRVPNDVANNPVIIGHEFCCELVEVGSKWQDRYHPKEKYSVQPALNYKGSLDAPGYSFQYIGGDATYIIIPQEVMEMNCLLPYHGEGYFLGSLAEPFSCIAAAFHENFHSDLEHHRHNMDIKKHGAMAILAGVGPMGLAAIEYAIQREQKPSLLVVTDIDQMRLDRAQELIPVEKAASFGVRLVYLNTATVADPVKAMRDIHQGELYDDVFVFAPVASLVEQADQLLARGGCLNFFAGPSNSEFSAKLNFYNIHYESHRVTGTSGGNTQDMQEVLDMFSIKKLRPEIMISHIGGLDSVIDTTLNLPSMKGAKKLVYTHISLPMTPISDFRELGKTDPMFQVLADICDKHKGLWSVEAETYLLQHAKKL
ncbi:MAG: zinc-binding dehydrogenase [Candidatus Izemoplasmatales bacterium]|nr:zinc-binding dehydrogenase [Candidatus Izemoplasmatales bacterium]NLF49003.1 zinc-binding dehydrogenase [Acholeplasmataceae bacterium]